MLKLAVTFLVIGLVLALLAANDGLVGLSPATPEQAADEAADRAAIAAEPLLPAPGTPERAEVDRRHAENLAGLLRAARGNGGR